MKNRVWLRVSVCAALLSVASVAQGANTTCANADFVFPGERLSYTIGASSSLFFKARVTAGRSYAVIAWAPFQDVGEGGAALGVSIFSDSTCTTAAAGTNAVDYEPLVFAVPGHSADHDNVIPTADGTIYIEVGNGIAAGYTAYVLVVETTIFSPWWFTGGSYQAFVTIRNNMNSTTTAQLTLYTETGTACGTANVVISGNGNNFVDVGSVGTCAGTFGSAQIAFPGTPGGVTANITTLSGATGLSFDAPFNPRFTFALPR